MGVLPPLSEGNGGGKAPVAQTGQRWGGMKADPDRVWAALGVGFPLITFIHFEGFDELRAVVFIRM